jgi:hypothetical protein
MSDHELKRLLAEAQARYDAMTPEQQAEHWRQQRESWVRAEIELSKWERSRTRLTRPPPPRVAAHTDGTGDRGE